MKRRLHKILARSTELSLRSAEKAISRGEVTVNGQVVTMLGSLADPEADIIKWKGKRIGLPQEKIYLIYNKPKNVLVTKRDPLGRPTIWTDLKKFKDKVNAAGRLDYDSEGLLILTSDGELINRLTHPRHEIRKVYYVKVKGFPSNDELNGLRGGLKYEGVQYRPAEIKFKSKTEDNTWIETRIFEGKNRQVRKMFSAIGHPVLKLKRIAIGPLGLRGLKTSSWRYLQGSEREALLAEVGLTGRRHRASR